MKNISIILAFFLSSMLMQAQTQIQSGSFNFNSSVAGYTLDKNTGERSTSIEVTYKAPFDKKPHVTLSTTMVDAENKTNVRYRIEASSISRNGFIIKATTWGETKIFGLSGNWFAFAEKNKVEAKEILDELNEVGHVALYINFETGKSDIKPESEKIIDQITEMLKKNPTLKVSIEGHTDKVGSASSNMTLSVNRANSVVAAIVAKGVDKSRLTAKGWGLTKPIADNETEEGRALNRRVEIVKN